MPRRPYYQARPIGMVFIPPIPGVYEPVSLLRSSAYLQDGVLATSQAAIPAEYAIAWNDRGTIARNAGMDFATANIFLQDESSAQPVELSRYDRLREEDDI